MNSLIGQNADKRIYEVISATRFIKPLRVAHDRCPASLTLYRLNQLIAVFIYVV